MRPTMASFHYYSPAFFAVACFGILWFNACGTDTGGGTQYQSGGQSNDGSVEAAAGSSSGSGGTGGQAGGGSGGKGGLGGKGGNGGNGGKGGAHDGGLDADAEAGEPPDGAVPCGATFCVSLVCNYNVADSGVEPEVKVPGCCATGDVCGGQVGTTNCVTVEQAVAWGFKNCHQEEE